MKMKQDIEKNDTYTYTYIKSNWEFFLGKLIGHFVLKDKRKRSYCAKHMSTNWIT